MYAWFYQQSTILFLPILAMVIFMIVFVASVARAWLSTRDPAAVTPMSNMPLKDEDRAVPPLRTVTGGGNHV